MKSAEAVHRGQQHDWTEARVATAGTLRLVNRRLGKRRRRSFPIACKQGVGRRVVLAQDNGDTCRQYYDRPNNRSEQIARIHLFASLHDAPQFTGTSPLRFISALQSFRIVIPIICFGRDKMGNAD